MNKYLQLLITETIKKTFSEAPEKLIERGVREIQYDICPHCKTEIYEKHEYTEDGGVTWRHSDCKGLIARPETPLEKINDWLRPYVAEARLQRQKAREALGLEKLPLSGDEKYIKQQQNQQAPMPVNVTGLPENRLNPEADPYEKPDDESGQIVSPDNDPMSKGYDPEKPTILLHPHPETVPQHQVNDAVQKSEQEETQPIAARDFTRFMGGTLNVVNASNVPVKVTISEFTSTVDQQVAKAYIIRIDNG